MTDNRFPRIGRRVLFAEVKSGKQLIHDAWIMRVWSDFACDLRVHRTAQPNLDFRRVPFAPELRAGSWTWRNA